MGTQINKEDLVSQLEHTKNNYIMGMAAFTIFSSGDAQGLLMKHNMAFGDYTISFKQVAKLLENERDRGIALGEFIKMLMRTLIKESFEHIKDYCEGTEQYAGFKGEEWYEFGRMIRNFLSHNCRFEFNKYDLERLPISWKGREITAELNGQSPDLNFFGYTETWELFCEFEDFVNNRLE